MSPVIVGGFLTRAYRREEKRSGAAKRADYRKIFFKGYLFGRYGVRKLERRATAMQDAARRRRRAKRRAKKGGRK